MQSAGRVQVNRDDHWLGQQEGLPGGGGMWDGSQRHISVDGAEAGKQRSGCAWRQRGSRTPAGLREMAVRTVGNDGPEGYRTRAKASPFLPSWLINRKNLFKSAFKFSNLILARSHPVTLLIPECPQSTIPTKPGGRLRLSASWTSLNPSQHCQLGTSPHKGSGPHVGTHTHVGIFARGNPLPSWVKRSVFCDNSP